MASDGRCGCGPAGGLGSGVGLADLARAGTAPALGAGRACWWGAVMAAPRWLRRLGASSPSDWLLRLIYVGLGAWAVGIAMAGYELDAWRQELSRTLLQLNADAQF